MCNLPKNNDGACSHLWGMDCGYKCCLLCPKEVLKEYGLERGKRQ